MSGRIALMVRGLPSVPIEEAVERFGKYYGTKSGVFHVSPSFTGMNTNNSISFVNAKTGGYDGGQGLNKQNISDLRKLHQDFKAYTTKNPGIYTNNPTSASRAKLYRRIGFKQDPYSTTQLIDTRRIADKDLPYTRAIDTAVYGRMAEMLSPNTLPAFVKSGDNVLAASRLDDNMLLSILKGQNIVDMLPENIEYTLSSKARRKAQKEDYGDDFFFDVSAPTQAPVNVPMTRTSEEENRRMYSALSTGDPSMRDTMQYWARQNGLGDISESNANDIAEMYWARADNILF